MEPLPQTMGAGTTNLVVIYIKDRFDNLMLDISMFCMQGDELRALLGSVDDVHGDIFKIFYKFMQCCCDRVEGFGLWIKNNPAEWLVKDQAFLLQGPLCHPAQRKAWLRRSRHTALRAGWREAQGSRRIVATLCPGWRQAFQI